MDEVAAAVDGAGQRGGIGEVTLGDLGLKADEVAPVRARPDQQSQPMPARGEHAGDGRADEAGRAGRAQPVACHAVADY